MKNDDDIEYEELRLAEQEWFDNPVTQQLLRRIEAQVEGQHELLFSAARSIDGEPGSHRVSFLSGVADTLKHIQGWILEHKKRGEND